MAYCTHLCASSSARARRARIGRMLAPRTHLRQLRMTAADLQATIAHMGAAARAASAKLRAAPTAAKNAALRALARRLRSEGAALAAPNAQDVAAARAAGLPEPLVDR